MSRREVSSVAVPAVEERRRQIEAEALPPNIGALLDAAADEVPNQLAWNFKVPRYIAYHDSLPKTPSEKIAKQALIPGGADLRAGSYDRVERRWR